MAAADCGPAGSQAAWSLAVLNADPPPGWMRALVGHTHLRIRRMQPQQAVHLLWAMSRMAFSPPRQYIEEVLVRVGVDCEPAQFK